MKKDYLTPELEVLTFTVEDVLAYSDGQGNVVDGNNDLGFDTSIWGN